MGGENDVLESETVKYFEQSLNLRVSNILERMKYCLLDSVLFFVEIKIIKI